MWEFLVSNYCVQPDVILYLRTPAKTCLDRILERGRAEEAGISLDYLDQLESLHDEWLLEHPNAVILNGEHWWTPQAIIAEIEAKL
jgi:deoxyadenosine/deoxycytidine kinase